MGQVKGRLRAKFARGLHRIIFKESEVNRMDDNTFLYVTTFVNKSETPWRVLEKGRDLLVVAPGQEDSIESWHNRTDWSRWSKVVREKDERLTLTENSRWQNPWQDKFYCVELVNESGAPEESVQVVEPSPAFTSARGYVTAMRGVPRIIPLHIEDNLIKWREIRWHKKEIRLPILGTKYFTTEWRVVKECVPRSKAELKAVLKERQAITAERLKEETAKALSEQEKMLMDGEEA